MNDESLPPPQEPVERGRSLRKFIIQMLPHPTADQPHHAVIDSILNEEEVLSALMDTENRYFEKNPRLNARIRHALLTKTDEHLYNTASFIADAYEEGGLYEQPADKLVCDLMNAGHQIDRIKIATKGYKSPTDRSNLLIELFLHEAISKLPKEALLTVHESTVKVAELTQGHIDNIAWFAPKLFEVQYLISNLINTDLFIADHASRREVISDDQIESQSEASRDLFKEIMLLRRYGVKLSYKEASIGGTWIFDEYSHWMSGKYKKSNNVHPLLMGQRVRAAIIHSQKPSFEDFRLQFQKYKQGPADYALLSLAPVEGDFLAYLLDDGELYHDVTGRLPMKETFKNRAAYQEYRQMQAELIANYFDLVMPAEIVDDLPLSLRPTVNVKTRDRKNDPIMDLLLPRLHYLKNPESKKNITAAEQSEGESDSKRTLRLHNVTWHRRTLPQGWRASPKALELASELNIELAPNETFVRAHKRGNEKKGQVQAHRVKKRSN